MGGIFIAMPSGSYVNYYNPAGLIGLDMVRFDGLVFYEGLGVSNGTRSAFSSTTNVGQAIIGIPFGSRLAASMTLYRFSRVDYDYVFEDGSFQGQTYRERLQGDGGIQGLSLSAAYRIDDRWSAGLSGHYMFGTINRRWNVNWDDGAFVDTRDRLEEHIQGARWTFGVLHRSAKFSAGAFASTSATFSNDVTGYSALEDTTAIANRDMKFPFEVGFGGMMEVKPGYLAGLDVTYGAWNGAGLTGDKFRNAWRVGVGAERKGSSNILASLLRRADYRLGFYVQNLYQRNAVGKFANEAFVTAGVGLPFAKGRHSVDLAFEFGKRGSVGETQVRDFVYRFVLSISAGEKWFQKRRRR